MSEERVKNTMKKTKKVKPAKVSTKKVSKRKQLKNIEKQLPKSYRPISGWGYFWRAVLYAIPVLGWIVLLINAIGSKNRNGRYFARSYFCALLLAVIAAVVLLVADTLLQGAIIQPLKDLGNQGIDSLRPFI